MRRLKTIVFSALAGGLGGAAAWTFILLLSTKLGGGILRELTMGALAGMFIGGFLWSREAVTGRQFLAAGKRAGYGAAAGVIGGGAGGVLGSTLFTQLGRFVADGGGFQASLGVSGAVALGWALLGAAVGASGGMMIRSRERTIYGLVGGSIGGLAGGVMLTVLSETSIWSSLAGLFVVGLSIGGFISLVEEAMVSAKVKVIKGRHLGREFSLLKDLNIIGRDDRSDVCLSGAEGVGMRHAFIKRAPGAFAIEQAGGGTGVYVNHQKTARSPLADGDIIRIGSVLLMFNVIRKAAAALVIVFSLLAAGHIVMHAGSTTAGEINRLQITQFDLTSFPTVKAYVSALDPQGADVSGLTAADLQIEENGVTRAVREMNKGGAAGTPEPLTVALVIDRSGSMTGEKLAHAKESVLRFLSLMGPRDRAALFAFSDDVTEVVPLTGNREQISSAALTVTAGGHTALYDAIVRGVDAVKGLAGRRAVIVLTDGITNRGKMDLDQAVSIADNSGASVSVIGLGGDVRTARLERIARETGGTYFFTPAPEGLASIYETISRRIKNEYAVLYETESRGEYLRTVVLSIKGRRTERAYFQPGSSLFGAGGGIPEGAFLIPVVSVLGFILLSLRDIEGRRRGAGHLSVVRGRTSKSEVDINGSVAIGRDERNGIGLFRDDAIAQEHAEVRSENGRYAVLDKGSPGGTLVNGKRIGKKRTLADGDVIEIGSALIVFSQGDRMPCVACGRAIRREAKFCTHCGAKNTERTERAAARRRPGVKTVKRNNGTVAPEPVSATAATSLREAPSDA